MKAFILKTEGGGSSKCKTTQLKYINFFGLEIVRILVLYIRETGPWLFFWSSVSNSVRLPVVGKRNTT